MTDLTRSPQPNELANLYEREKYLEEQISLELESIRDFRATLRDVRKRIKRACGDRETQS